MIEFSNYDAETISPVSKSYIPGKGWVPAMKAGKKALRGAKGGHAKAKGVSPKDEAARNMMGLSHKEVTGTLRAKKVGTTNVNRGVKADRYETYNMPAGAEAFAYIKPDRTRVMVTKPGADKRFVQHEAAHLSPKKRTPHRMYNISQNPGKAMREEARADSAGGMGWREAKRKGNVGMYKDTFRGEGYSGYAASGASRFQASQQRQAGGMVDAATNAARKQEGMDPKLYSDSRRRMFNQKSLGGYRQVQDNIDAGKGIKYKRTAAQQNRRERIKDVAYPAAGAGIIGGGLYAVDRHDKKQEAKLKARRKR